MYPWIVLQYVLRNESEQKKSKSTERQKMKHACNTKHVSEQDKSENPASVKTEADQDKNETNPDSGGCQDIPPRHWF